MSKFNVIPKNGGDPKYSGTPTFTGTYMKPGMLEFREVASPTPIEWNAGDYVVYSRLGNRVYRLYNTPQVKKQARSTEYGGAFIYQNVQFFDDSKQLEICPFRDLVQGDNRIHFSTQPSISTFEAVDGLARRFQACLEDMYGTGSWVVRVATVSDDHISQDLANLMAEPREFTVSGVNLLECLNKVYEIWPEVGWIYKVESNKNTIIIGGAGLNNNVGTYQYGKGNGLRSITRTIANADELANRIFAYGSSRNMLPRWYNSQNIKDAESVDIQHLMIPISEWGTTNVDGTNLPDPAKAYVEDETSQAAIGLRPATVYFDGSGDYPEIYPTIRETTIKMVRDALGSSSAKYYPSTAKYPNENERVDRLLTAPSTFDDGLAGDEGKSAAVADSVALGTMTDSAQVSGSSNATVVLFHEDYTMTKTRLTDITLSAFGSGTLTTQGGTGAVYLVVSIQKSEGGSFTEIKRQSYELEANESNEYAFRSVSCTAADTDVTVGDVVRVYFSFYIANTNGEESLTYSYSVSPNVNFSAAWSRKKTFTVSIRQIGFDIGAQADLGDGKTIAMRTGACAGRTFAIKSVQYNPATETWNLECYRSEDESLSQWFPNTDFPVRGLENAGQSNEYPGDEFVLLDITMPDIYIGMAESKLLTEAQGLLTDTATERWQYIPDIDAKYMVENSRVIWAGEYMTLSDTDVLDVSPTSILVDSVTINDGEAAIPTYKVTLRDRKRTTWTESTTAPSISSKPVSNATQDSIQSLSSQTADSYFTLDASGNVTLKEKYSNLWVPGWLAAGGVGSGGGGGGALENLVDVELTNPTNNDLLRYNGTKWVNIPQSSITPTLSVSTTGDGNALTAVSYANGVFSFTKGATFLTSSDLNGYVPTSRKVNGHALTADVTVTAGDVGLGNVSNIAASDYFTAMTMDGDDLSLTIGGTTKKYTVGYATTAIQTRFTPSETGASQITPLLDWFVPETYTEDNTTKYRLRLNPKYAGMYADGWVAAGGVGSASSGGGSLETLTDVELTSLATNDLLRYNGTKWVNVSQSSIMPTLSVVVPSTGNALTGVTYSNGTFTFTTGTFLTGVKMNGSNVTVTDGIANLGTVLTSHQSVTNSAATLTAGQTVTLATIGSTNITAVVPSFASQSSVTTLQGYFTNGAANNALKLENHAASYFATASDLTSLSSRVTSLESMFEIVDGNVHVKNNMGLYSDSWIAAGGTGSGSGGGYGVEEITSNQDGTIDFHFSNGDTTNVDLNHTHDGLLPDVTSTDNGKIMKVVNGAWALANESGGGGSSLPSVTSSDNGKALMVVSGAWAAQAPSVLNYAKYELVSSLPANPDSGTLYLIAVS